MLALGIDVGGERKGLDAVVLDEDLVPFEPHKHLPVGELGALIGRVRPDVVAIDSPPRWRADPRGRASERDLRARGISLYATPSEEAWNTNRFYAWMREGKLAFEAAAAAGFPLATRAPVRGKAIEVFPYATAIVLSGALRPGGWRKLEWRRKVLADAGVVVGGLSGIDQVDAALAALTGLLALGGQMIAPGDPDEGAIVLPASELPVRYGPGS